MTHPLTPREKVEQAVKDAIREDASVGLQMTLTPRFMRGLVDRVLAATSVVDHETGLVSDKSFALASGSGDHSGGVTDMIGSGDHAELADRLLNVSLRWDDADQEREEASRAITSLIAEVAALRVANTEAERKLAEAVSVLHEIAKGEAPPEKHGHYLAHREAVKAARTFISKEAERG